MDFIVFDIKWAINFTLYDVFVRKVGVLFEFFCVDVGVALSVSGFCFDEIGEFFAKYSEIHVAVKINYYNILNLGLYKNFNLYT